MNSNPLNNDTLYNDYGKRFGDFCEVAFYLGLTIKAGRPNPLWENLVIQQPLNRHHIWSVGRRPDYRSNLIICTVDMHNWFHAHLPESRIISVLCKLRKRERISEPEEFSIPEINAAAGKLVPGAIENYRLCSNAGLFEKWQSETLSRLAVLEKEGVA